MRFFLDAIKSVFFTIYILFILAAAVVSFYLLVAWGFPGWASWAGALGTIVVLGVPYLFWPRGDKDTRGP